MKVSLVSLALLILFASIPALAQSGDQGKPLWEPYYISPRTGPEHLLLNGQWELGYRDAPITNLQDVGGIEKWIHAQVPDSVQWSLYRAGVLPDPYQRLNSRKYTWVPDKVWYYRRQFRIPASARNQYAFLCFDGVGYYTRIWLNGTLLGRNEGMFGGPNIEVSRYLRFDRPNDLVVEVKAGSYGVPNWDPDHTGKVTLPWGLAGGSASVTTSSKINPKEFIPFGIWQSVRLEIVPKTHLERPFLITMNADSKEARLLMNVEVLADSTAIGQPLHPWKETQLRTYQDSWTTRKVDLPFGLRVELVDKSSSQTVLLRNFPLTLYRGRNWVREELRLDSPKLWWPNGMGDPHLYQVRLSLLRAGRTIDSLQFDYGIRTIQQIRSAGPRTQDRWANWQFVVNGRKLFVKGVNWSWPLDELLHLPAWRYRWLLEAARAEGIQMIRVWGGGNPETDEFYSLCNQLGIMVWEDFPIGNAETPLWPQDVWEAQVMQIVFRLRNYSSLAVWSGGNEFNPYTPGNTASVGIIERSVRDFDGTRLFVRTTPDAGDAHIYINMDPTWYSRLYHWIPFISETGIFNVPEPQSILQVVDKQEMKGPIHDIFSKQFADSHPEFIHHFLEYRGQEPRTLAARASQIDDMTAPDLQRFCDASQIAAGEFIQIVSDLSQANFPITTGLMPWSLTVPWPIEFFAYIDGLNRSTAAYYFLKRTYEPTHITVRLPDLIWGAGEEVLVDVSVIQAPPQELSGLAASVDVYDTHFKRLWHASRAIELKAGPSVNDLELGKFKIPRDLEAHYFLMVAELRNQQGTLLSRSVYWPRCLKQMGDPAFRRQYRSSPQPSLVFNHGPWLRREVATTRTTLELNLVANRRLGPHRSEIVVNVRNTGSRPAFLVHFKVLCTNCASYATDNFFWLDPGETRLVRIRILLKGVEAPERVVVDAWNAPATTLN
ncbi:MAG TPA: beta-mannosidase [Terriglobia bacterium]|nr:beta-mannosidase [Terriglobia bacterium]